jgi:N-methylhydantoinase A
MEREGEALLAAAGLRPADVQHRRQADLRYAGQGHEVRIDLPDSTLQTDPVVTAFEAEYRRLYGRLGPPVALEAITWRIVSSGPEPTVDLRIEGPARGAEARKGERPAWFPEAGGMRPTPVFDRYSLRPGDAITGPAIVEERESTVLVGPDAHCVVDEHLSLVVTP